MPRQFDVYAPPAGPLVVIVQSDILDQMPTRVAIPLLDLSQQKIAFSSLTPQLVINGEPRILVPQLIATFTIVELGVFVTDVSEDRDTIIRAMDALIGGI